MGERERKRQQAEDGDLVGVASEGSNVVVGPLQGGRLVKRGVVSS